MAVQGVVRALVPSQQADRMRDDLLELDGANIEAVTVSAPDPASTYRGEEGDLELHKLVRFETLRMGSGIVAGAALGALAVAVMPWLHDWMPASLILLMFGGAWGGAVVAASFGVQVDKRNDALPDTHYEVNDSDADDLRVLTVIVPHGRTQALNYLEDRDATLLDSHAPKVGRRDQPEQR